MLDRQKIQRFVKSQQILRSLRRSQHSRIDFDTLPTSTASQRSYSPGALDQYSAHRLGGRGEEVAAPIPSRILGADQPQVSLMYERGRLECVSRRFPSEPLDGQPAQLGVYQGQQLLGGLRRLLARLPR